MKKRISLLLCVAMLCALALPALAVEDATAVRAQKADGSMEGSIVILHSNDVHGAVEGYAKMAAAKEMYTLMGAEVLVLDAGDFSQGTTAVSVSQGMSAVSLMNMVGYDAAAPGNHEFDYGYDNLKKLERSANFPILAANITKDGELALGDRLVFSMEKSGKTVGVFGLDTPETASKAHPAKLAGVRFAGGEELYAVAQAQVNALKAQGADYIVCLGHLGIDAESAAAGNRSIDLLEKVTGIDVFIDGHSHSTLDDIARETGEGWKVGDTLLTSTGAKFASVGAVEIAPDGTITLQNWPAERVSVPADSPVAAEAAKIQAEIQALYGARFAQTEVLLDGDKELNRTSETNLGDLIADAMLWSVTRDGALEIPVENMVAITNGGSIRATVQAGDITRNHINSVLPSDNTVAVVYVPGTVLLEALESSTYCTPEAVSAFPQVSGIRFTVDATVAYDQGEQYGDTTYYAPASIRRVTIQDVNGQSFDPSATYAVVTNDFLAAGGDTYYALAVSDTVVDTGIPMDEAVTDYITQVLEGAVTAQDYGQTKGRVTIIQPETPTSAGDELDQNAWYYAAAQNVMDTGVMTGTGNGFAPEGTVTRATVFQTLYNMEGRPAVNYPSGHLLEMNAALEGITGYWWTDAALWAYQTGLTTGTGGTGFAGDRMVTRAEIVTVLYRYAQMKGADVSIGEETNILPYEDAENVAPWAVPAFQWAVGAKVISGKTSGSEPILAPGETATRAELAQILTNYIALPAAAPSRAAALLRKSVSLDQNGAPSPL